MPVIRIILFLLLMINAFGVSASGRMPRFGKINLANLQDDICPIDSNAHAYYIFHNGKADFYHADNFKLRTRRHFRIKIIDETALDMASIEVSLYGIGIDAEKISSIKAMTYNADGDEIIESKMERDAIVYETESAKRTIAKFTLPNVKAGSIIEVEYTVTSGYIFNLNTWHFQSELPILVSRFLVNIPEYLDYKQFHHGYIQVDIEKSKLATTLNVGKEVIDTYDNRYDFKAVNVPAFLTSEFLTARKNYISSVEFELSRFSLPGYVYEDYSSSWSQISSKLLVNESFGAVLKNARCFNDIAEAMVALEPATKMYESFEYIKEHTDWNNYNACLASQSLKRTLETGRGNAADINLALVALMRKTGLEAYPVALSTRNHGFVNRYFPMLSSLNYVVALCRVDGHSYLMDATNDYTSIDLLPTRCLNGQGLLIKENSDAWVSLQGDNVFSEYHSYVLDLTEDGQLKGRKMSKLGSYAAHSTRNHLAGFASEDDFINDLEDRCSNLLIKDYTLKNVEDLDEKMLMQTDIEIINGVSMVNGLMYLKPMLYERWDSNPLKITERLYPVEYPYPYSMTCAVQIKLPEGYTVESLPEALNMVSQHGDCVFKFMSNMNNGVVTTVYSQFKRTEMLYPFTEYQNLKAFYEQVVKKHNEQVVFRKI